MEEGNYVRLGIYLSLHVGSDLDCSLISISALAAGAGNLIPEMIKRGIPSEDITVNQLALSHWVIVADVFDEWPFKPSVGSAFACVL